MDSTGTGYAATVSDGKSTTHTAHVSAYNTDLDIYSIDQVQTHGLTLKSMLRIRCRSNREEFCPLDHLDGMFQKIWVRGGNPKVMLTEDMTL